MNTEQEKLNKAQFDQTQAQKRFDNVQKAADPVIKEYTAKKQIADAASESLKQNETDLAKSQANLNTLQTKNDQLAKTVNDTQSQMDKTNKELSSVKTDLTASQDKVNKLNAQASGVNSKLADAIAKRDQAKSAMDSQSDNVQKIVVPDAFKNAYKKWCDIDGNGNVADITNANKAEFIKDMHDTSTLAYNMNKYQHNANDAKRKVDVYHLTDAQRLEMNKFGVNLWNQIRTQMGYEPVKLTKGSLAWATDIADGYIKDNYDILHSFGHDEKAILKASDKYNVRNDMESSASANDSMFNMDDLKAQVYDVVCRLIFNPGEWVHTSSMLYHASWLGKPMAPYGAIGLVTNSTKYHLNGEIVDSPVLFNFDLVSAYDINNNKHSDSNVKFDTTLIPTEDSNASQAQGLFIQANNIVNDLQKQKNDLDGQIKTLNDHIKQDQNKVTDLTKQLTNLTSTLNAAKTEQQNVQSQLMPAENKVNSLKKEQPALIQARDNAAKDLATYKQDHTAVINDYNNAKSELEKANKQVEEITDSKATAEKNLAESKDKLAKINNDLSAVKSQLSELQTKLANAKMAQSKAKDALTKAQADYDNYVSTHKDLIDAISASDKTVAEKKAAVDRAQKLYDDANKDYEVVKANIDKLTTKIDNLDKSIAKSQNTVNELTNSIASNTKIIESNKQIHTNYAKSVARQNFDAQINQALDNVEYGTKTIGTKTISQHTVKVATVNPVVRTKNTKHSLPQTGANDKVSLFATLAGLSLSALGLGSLVSDKKRKRN